MRYSFDEWAKCHQSLKCCNKTIDNYVKRDAKQLNRLSLREYIINYEISAVIQLWLIKQVTLNPNLSFKVRMACLRFKN